MFICLYCNAVFSEPDEAVVNRFPAGEQTVPIIGSVCPNCGYDEIAEAVQCDICGEWFDELDLYDNDERRFCKNCLDDGRAHLHHPYCAEDR